MGRRLRKGPDTKWLVFGIALAIAITGGWWGASQTSAKNGSDGALMGDVNRPSVKAVVHLYFGDDRGRHLVAEQRIVEKPSDAASFAKLLVAALIEGPSHGASRTVPEDARLDAIYVAPSGIAYIDFSTDSFIKHPGGIGAEMLSIYSIVNTLVLNVEEIRTVKLLIGGREADTLVGHVDLQAPFEVDMMWVR